MNYAQLLLFIVYVLSMWCAGAGVHALLTGGAGIRLNRIVYVGETLLLGSMLIVAELLLLGMAGLFRAEFLWSAVAVNFLFLLSAKTRRDMALFRAPGFEFGISGFLFGLVLLGFVFRNCYFLIDVDSLSTYLYTQRLWLEAGTSLIGGPTFDMRIFNPQYDNVAYSLGLSLFGQETLFPALVNLGWRVIAVVLLFGYTTYRSNGWYGLASVLFVVLNDHFLFSGVNQAVLMNGAVIAFMFAAAYNFWEAKRHNSVVHVWLALIFLTQIIGNKLYTIQAIFFLFLIGILVQQAPWVKIRMILTSKKFMAVMIGAISIAMLGYLKNFMVTGDFLFPFFSGQQHLLDRAQEQQTVLLKIIGGMSFPKLLKFLSYLFIWPGITAAKYVFIGLVTLPFVVIAVFLRSVKEKPDELVELCFWLGASLLLLVGMCLSAWQDPRPYRFPICVFAFTAVLYLRFLLGNVLRIKWAPVVAGLVLVLSLQGYKIVYANSGGAMYPTIKDNMDVLTDRVHMDDVVRKYHPEVLVVREALRQNPDKLRAAAWFAGDNSNAFLLPDRPRISLLFSSTIKWDSYNSREQIIVDLDRHGIKWVMMLDDRKERLEFVSAEDFSLQAMRFNRNPQSTMYDYGFPRELTDLSK